MHQSCQINSYTQKWFYDSIYKINICKLKVFRKECSNQLFYFGQNNPLTQLKSYLNTFPILHLSLSHGEVHRVSSSSYLYRLLSWSELYQSTFAPAGKFFIIERLLLYRTIINTFCKFCLFNYLIFKANKSF